MVEASGRRYSVAGPDVLMYLYILGIKSVE